MQRALSGWWIAGHAGQRCLAARYSLNRSWVTDHHVSAPSDDDKLPSCLNLRPCRSAMGPVGRTVVGPSAGLSALIAKWLQCR